MTTAGRPEAVDVAAHDRAVLDERVRVYLEYSGPGGPTLSRSDLTALLDRLAEAEAEVSRVEALADEWIAFIEKDMAELGVAALTGGDR